MTHLRIGTIRLAAIAFSYLGLSAGTHAALHFDVEPIPTNGASIGKPTGINDLGWVVTANGYLWDGVTTKKLPNAVTAVDLNGPYSAGTTGTQASAWNGLTQNILNPTAGYIAYGVNDQGTAVGWKTTNSGPTSFTDAVVFKNGAVTLLPRSTYTDAYAQRISSSDTVVGRVATAASVAYPAMWVNGVLTVLSTTVPGQAWGVNDAGDVAWSSQTGDIHLWKNGVDTFLFHAISTFNVLGLNDYGDVASGSMLYHDGVVYPLNSLVDNGVTISEIWGINNSMQIAALTSIGPARLTLSVPEPTSMSLLFAGMIPVVARRNVRR